MPDQNEGEEEQHRDQTGAKGKRGGHAQASPLPLPACGERETPKEFGAWMVPLTRRAARVDLSPQAGRGKERTEREVGMPGSIASRRPLDREAVDIFGGLGRIEALAHHREALCG